MNPQRLGSRYLLHDRLGQGAMGVVWRGQDLETGAWVAVKLLRPDYASSPAAVSRFVGERNALVRFRHPNVVNLRDMIVEGDRLALVMDLITGGDLDTFRQHSGGTLAPSTAVQLTGQICDGLAAAHTAGIIHRDLKPSNVLLQAGQVKLADFGISRITGEARRTTTGTVMGTPTYLSPEAINGAEPTSAGDVYAAGITLYELLTSQPPFDGHVVAVMQAHLQREPDRIAGLSDPLWNLIAACLDKNPAGRPTAADLARSLKDLQENTGAETLGPGPARPLLPPAPPRTVAQLARNTAQPGPAQPGQAHLTGQTQALAAAQAARSGQFASPQAPAAQFPGAQSLTGQNLTGQSPAAQSPAPGELPAQGQSPLATMSPRPTMLAGHETIPPGQPQTGQPQTGQQPTGQQPAGQPPPGQPPTAPPAAAPLAVPGAGGGSRKRLLIGLAALIGVIAIAAVVYATSFAGQSTTSLTGTGLTKPTVGAGTSPGQPTPSHGHTGSPRPLVQRTTNPSPNSSATSAKPGHSPTHPAGKASTVKATHPASSPATSPASTVTVTVTPPVITGTPPPAGVWQCTSQAATATQTLTACIRIQDNGLQVVGRLSAVTLPGDSIQLAIKDTNTGSVDTYSGSFCAAPEAVCTTGAIPLSAGIAGNYYVIASWRSSGTKQATQSISPVIYFPGS